MVTIALIDADNFYVSCERIFNASLLQRPVVVLSANDANVIARSPEARALGISMGMPTFQLRTLLKDHDIVQVSSNFSLYGDISARMMKTIRLFTSDIEEYSIDEAFADISFVPTEHLRTYSTQLRSTILQYTGIPVSVGIASSKVLAKVATEVVKHHPEYEGVLSLYDLRQDELDALLDRISVEDLWGIGIKRAARLQIHGIYTARQLRDADPAWIRRLLHVSGTRMVLELRGIACLPLETRTQTKQRIMVSQSFGRPIEQLVELEEATALYASMAAVKLRRQHSLVSHIEVFIHTNFFESERPQYARSESITLPIPTAFTPDILAAALTCVRHIYKPGYRFKKAGVSLTHLTPQTIVQPDLFGFFQMDAYEKQLRLMQVLDDLNRFWGTNTLYYGAIGLKREWQMRQSRKSPHYTTRWRDLVVAHSSPP